MKKIIAAVSVISLIICFSACGTKTSDTEIVDSEDEEITFTVDSTVSSKEEADSDEPDENEDTDQANEDESDSVLDEGEEVYTEENEYSENGEYGEYSEDNMDVESSVKVSSGSYEYGGISIVLPEGFIIDESAGDLVLSYPETYPMESDNINLYKTNESINIYSEDNINKTMKTLFDNYGGCKNYKQYNIGKCQAVRYEHTITVGGVPVEQKQVVVFGDDTVVISFTNVSGNYADAFEKTIESIKVLE